MDIDIHSLLFCVNKTLYERKFVVSVSNYHLIMNCNYCQKNCIKKGKQKNGTQKFFCCSCKKYQQMNYQRQAFRPDIDKQIITLVKESCGTRSISRILTIAPNTVTSRIKQIASRIQFPCLIKGRSYEVDELITYIGKKESRYCLTYAIDRTTKDVVSFSVGRRTKKTLGMVVNTLLLSEAKEIRTDRLSLYLGLIPKEIHHVKQRGINSIERKNLTLRTHVKRLNRRTICYSKSLLTLSAIMRIYFWG